MLILAIGDGKYVYAYNEEFQQVLKELGELHQYTDRTIAICRGKNIYIYNEYGSLIATYPKDFIDISNTTGIFL